MTAREYCKSHPVTAYDSSYGRCGGFQIHGDIEYGIDDYLYGMSGALCEDEKYHSYHHLKIIYISWMIRKNAMQCILTFLMFWLIMIVTNSKHRFGRMNLVSDGKHLIFLTN